MKEEQNQGSGFLITCDKNKQKQAIKDAYNFLGEYIQEIYGDIQITLIQKQLEKTGKDHNLQNQMKVRSSMKNKFKLLSSVDTNVNCLVFIKINESIPDIKIDPYRIVVAIMKDVHKQNRQLTRFCHKILPVQRSFKAEHFKMLDAIDEMFQHRDNSEIKSWALNFKCRNNSKFNYKQVLKETEKIAKKYGHFVDIYYPQWTVAVQIVHHLMCLAIVDQFKQFQQFRLHPKGQRLAQINQISDKSSAIKQKKVEKQRLEQQRQKLQTNHNEKDNQNIELLNQNVKIRKVGQLQEKSQQQKKIEQQNKKEEQNLLLKQKIRVQDEEDVDFI